MKVFNTIRQLTVYLIDSDAPLLIARPTLEEWGIVCDFQNKRVPLLDEPELGWKTLPQSDKGHLLFDLVDSKAFGDPMGSGTANAKIYSADADESRSGTESSASSDSTGPDEVDSPIDDEENFESNVLSADFESTASIDKSDILVRANHDQLERLEETFVVWKLHVELLTTAADQSQGSRKVEERRRERGDTKLIWECYVGRSTSVSTTSAFAGVY